MFNIYDPSVTGPFAKICPHPKKTYTFVQCPDSGYKNNCLHSSGIIDTSTDDLDRTETSEDFVSVAPTFGPTEPRHFVLTLVAAWAWGIAIGLLLARETAQSLAEIAVR